MTISSETRKAGPYTGNGSTTTFPFAFKVFTTADVLVVRTNLSGVETNLTLGTDYSVSLNADQNANAGGSVTLPSALTSGFLLTIGSKVAYLQQVDLTNQGGFYPAVINAALDKLTIFTQQLKEQLNRSAKLPISSTADADTLSAAILQLANDQANIDAVAGDLTNINTVAGNTTNINTVAGVSGNVTTVAGISSDVTAVAGNATNITAVKNNATNINTVAGINANVTTVAGISANVTSVANNATNINTNATNITAIQNASTNATNAANSATAAATSASNAATSETNAATSAAAAAASAASGMYSAVQDKSANYTVVAADAGDLIRINTSGGARTITLPAISTVSDGFKVAIVKWTGDANLVTVQRSGSDTINGAASVQISNQYSQIVFVADFETNTWFGSQNGLGATNKNVDRFSGNASTTAFTLTSDPSTYLNTDVYIGGIHQDHSTYSTSSTTLTFSSAPPTGTNNIEVVYGTPLAIGTPSDDTVSTAKLQAGAVTPAKMSTGAPTWDTSGNATTLSAGTSTSHRGNIVNTLKTNGSGYNVTQRLSDNVANSADMSMLGGVTQFSNNGVVSHTANGYGLGLGATTPANGTGLAFPATQNQSSDANTLDDYEEGTWTPVWGAVSGSMTYAAQVGRYVKVGRLVVATCHIITSANNALSGTIYLNGLPFTSDSSSGNYVPCPMHVENVNLAASTWIWAHVNPNAITAQIRYWINNAPAGSLQGSALNAGSDMMLTITYITT